MIVAANICGPAVARLRHERGYTQQELRRRCILAGWPVARSVLAKIENQSRAVSDRELVTFARVLKVDVVKLLRASRSHK